MKIDKFRTFTLIFGGAIGLITGTQSEYLLNDASKLIDILVPTFSVLAGFLIATNAFLIIDSSIDFKSKTSGDNFKKTFKRRLARNAWLFYSYLFVLLSILCSTLLKDKFPNVSANLESLYIGLGLASLIWSFALPGIIAQIQLEKSEIAEFNSH